MRTFESTRRWSAEGSRRFLDTVSRLGNAAHAGSSLLPGWSRRQLIAHVSAHTDALCNLARWASTGVRTPIHVTMAERVADMERGAGMSPTELLLWLRRSNAELTEELNELTSEQWETEVVTADSEIITVSEIPWLHAREAWVHLVDLGVGVRFRDLPGDFLHALVGDLVARHSEAPLPDGPIDELAASLARRSHHLNGAGPLGPWL